VSSSSETVLRTKTVRNQYLIIDSANWLPCEGNHKVVTG